MFLASEPLESLSLACGYEGGRYFEEAGGASHVSRSCVYSSGVHTEPASDSSLEELLSSSLVAHVT